MAASDIPDPRPVTDSPENTSSRQPEPVDPQLCPPDGVSTNVSSVAIDRGLLAGGLSARDNDRRLPNLAGASAAKIGATANSTGSSPDADVDVMLRVKTGDESAFAYLVQKYRRAMVGFMYRLCRNPSTAEELAQEVFLRVYRSRATYEPSTAAARKNCSRTNFNRRSRRRRSPI